MVRDFEEIDKSSGRTDGRGVFQPVFGDANGVSLGERPIDPLSLSLSLSLSFSPPLSHSFSLSSFFHAPGAGNHALMYTEAREKIIRSRSTKTGFLILSSFSSSPTGGATVYWHGPVVEPRLYNFSMVRHLDSFQLP